MGLFGSKKKSPDKKTDNLSRTSDIFPDIQPGSIAQSSSPTEPLETEQDWMQAGVVDGLRLGQWAALCAGYRYIEDINDDMKHRPWNREYVFLKRSIQSSSFKPKFCPDPSKVWRATRIARKELKAFYLTTNKRPRAIFGSDYLPQGSGA